MSKAEATRLAVVLRKHDWVPIIEAAAALLERWPDGEPVAEVEADGVLRFKKTGRKWQVGDKLYTAPPDSAARIAELEKERDDFHMQYRVKCDEETKAQAVRIAKLEAVLKVAGEALDSCDADGYNPGLVVNALLAIKEAQR